MMQISRFSSEKDNRPDSLALDWLGLVEYLRASRRVTPCETPESPCPGKECRAKFGAAWSPTEFKDNRRLNKNALAVYVAVFDLDHLNEAALDKFVPWLEMSGLECVLHSTHSSRVGDWCFRLIFPLSRPVTPKEWKSLRANAIRTYSLPADPSTKDEARLYFLPTTPVGHASTFAHLNAGGRTLEVESLLTVGPGTQAGDRVQSPNLPSAAVVAPAPPPLPAGQLAPVIPISLKPLIDRLQGLLRKSSTKDATKVLVRRALDGNPLADEGGRDDALQSITSTLACTVEDEFPSSALLAFLHPSVRGMPQGPADPDWTQVAAEKLERNRERIREERVASANVKATINRRARERSAARAPAAELTATEDEEAPDPEGFYSDEQLERWAQEQGCDGIEDLKGQLVVQYLSSYRVLENGVYSRPQISEELEIHLHRQLACAPVTLEWQGQDGEIIERPVRHILREHCAQAKEIVASLSAQRSTFNPRTQVFTEAPCPMRKVEAREHPEIGAWLALADSPQLLDWLSVLPRLDRAAAALYMHGPPSTGKSLLVTAIARLWGEKAKPTTMDAALSDFNERLADCPIVWADERLPDRKQIQAELRTLLGTDHHEVRIKRQNTKMLEGYPRVVISANNPRLLDTGEDRSVEDARADAMRFLFVHMPAAMAEYLNSIGGPPETAKWLAEDRILEHVMWLAQTRVVDETARFLCAGRADEAALRGASRGRGTDLLREWLVSWLSEGRDGNGHESAGDIVVGGGNLLVNVAAMKNLEEWVKRCPSDARPPRKMGSALKQISLSQRKERVGARRVERRFHVVDVEDLFAWAEANGEGDVDAMRARLNAPVLVRGAIPTPGAETKAGGT